MPVIGFICPDGEKVLTDKCLKECRLKDSLPAGRCKAKPFLKRAASQREWNGTPSVTQLLNGVRESFLKITHDYYIDPEKKTAAMIGTQVHNMLYKLAETEYAEETIIDDILSGTYDFYDPENETLIDYKTWGAWKIVKILNDERPHERSEALFDVVMQMTRYKMLIKSRYPELPIKRIAVQVISREVNLQHAIKKGVEQGSPLIILPEVDETLVEKYFQLKAEMLKQAIEQNWAPLCNSRENWNEKKCSSFCEVKNACMQLVPSASPLLWQSLIEEVNRTESAILSYLETAEVLAPFKINKK